MSSVNIKSGAAVSNVLHYGKLQLAENTQSHNSFRKDMVGGGHHALSSLPEV